jgi:enoyl-CoA hydratase/carnithine racemase
MSKTRERKGSVCRMTGADRQTLYEVFGQALDSEEALLAGYYTEIDPDDYRRNRIPASLKADARAAERRIARYKKLREKLLGSTR